MIQKNHQNYNNPPCLMWLNWLGGIPQSKRSQVGFPVRAHAWVVGAVPSGREATGQCFSHIDVSLHLFLPPSSFL